MEKHRQVGLLGGATEWIDTTGKTLCIDSPPTEDREIRLALSTRFPFWQPTVLISSKAFVLVGGYRSLFTQTEDYDLWLRIAEHFEVANLSGWSSGTGFILTRFRCGSERSKLSANSRPKPLRQQEIMDTRTL